MSVDKICRESNPASQPTRGHNFRPWQFRKCRKSFFVTYLKRARGYSFPAPLLGYLQLTGQSIDMKRAVFIVISQSGRSPDLVMGAQSARKNGALTVAIVNDSTSPLCPSLRTDPADRAGIEHSVAATKSVVLSMMIGVQTCCVTHLG